MASSPPPPDGWAFLDPWFARLRGCVAVDEPTRADSPGALGRDPETDWRLRIDAHEDRLVVRDRREAVLLAGALAQLDNAAWVHKLRTLSAFTAPPFMDLARHALRADFVVAVNELTSRHGDSASWWLERGGASDAFTRDWELLCGRAEATSLDRTSLWPRLQFRVLVRGEPFLQFLETMVTKYLEDRDQDPDAPGFEIDSLDLTVLCMWGKPTVPDALRRIVELGIPIHHMDLSFSFQHIDGDRSNPEWREAFVRFVRVVCGHETHANRARTSVVRTLTIPEIEVAHPDFDLLCSGLQHSRGIRHFAIGTDVAIRANDPAEPFPPGVWALIALSLFSRDSSTSVEAFSVRGVPITLEDTEAVFDMVALVYPMEAYVSEHVPNAARRRPANRAPRKVSLPRGTSISSYYGFEEEEYTIDLEHDTEAFVAFEDAGIAHALIPGRGFCQVSKSVVPSKRLRQTRRPQSTDEMTSSLLKSLELVTHPHDTTTQAQLKEFLQFSAGSALRRLSLAIPNLRDQEIRDVFEMCPNLEHFAIADATLSSMTPFEDARKAGVRLRSLELAQLRVPDKPLTDYLRGVLSRRNREDKDNESVLTGLRIGQVSDVVLEQLRSSLEDSSIQYLDYSITKPVQSTFARLAEQHNHKPTGDVLAPLPAASTMAFLASIRSQAASRTAFNLTDEMKALIVNFASIPLTRVVICREVDQNA